MIEIQKNNAVAIVKLVLKRSGVGESSFGNSNAVTTDSVKTLSCNLQADEDCRLSECHEDSQLVMSVLKWFYTKGSILKE